jgi:hypothetical protein
MKRVLLVIMALLVLCANQVQAANLNKYSDDAKVLQALRLLENTGSTDVFDRLDKSSTKIIFYDLSLIDYSYAKHYAVSSTDENGNNYILINEKFRNSPTEAIACLIAHESVHILPQATLDEEVRATTKEAQTWIKVRGSVGVSSTDDLVKRENKLAMMYQSSSPNENLIKQSIEGNSFYQQQLAMK